LPIYRGPGGSGDAVGDATSEVLLALQAKEAAIAAKVAAETAQTNAETAETNAETAAAAAATFNPALYVAKANNLSDVTNAATARTNLGLAIGTNVQAYDADLATIAGLTPTNNYAIIGNGTSWTSSALPASGVTSVAATVPSFLSVAGSPITSSGTLALSYSGTALPVANGGTGATTLTANNVILGNGTSAPSFVAPSTNGNVLTSNGTTWTSAAASGSPLVFLGTTLITSAVANVSFTGLSSSTYIAFMVQYQGIEPGSDVNNLRMQIGNDTVGWIADAYYSNILTNGSTNENTGSVASFKLTDANVRSSTNGGCAGIAWVTQVSNSSALPGFFSDTSWWGYAPYTSRAGGNLDSTDYSNRAAVTRIRLFYASGNINKGRISLYGLKAS